MHLNTQLMSYFGIDQKALLVPDHGGLLHGRQVGGIHPMRQPCRIFDAQDGVEPSLLVFQREDHVVTRVAYV